MKLQNAKLNWKIIIPTAILGLFLASISITMIGQVDKNSPTYKRCLFEAKNLVEESAFADTPNDSVYLDLSVTLPNLEIPGQRKACAAAFADLRSTWNNNGGTVNATNWDYIVSISAPEETQNRTPSTPVKSNDISPSPSISTSLGSAPSSHPTKSAVQSPLAMQTTSATPSSSASPSAISYLCKPNVNCPPGSIGPGGGVVFFDAGSKQPWGRYLEVSLKELPEVRWCPLSENSQVILGTSKAIGSGAANTQKMKEKCTQEPGSAAYVATQFTDHGYTDWFIPSLDELVALKNSGTWDKLKQLTTTGEIASSTQLENGAQYIYYWIIQDGITEGAWRSPTSIPLVRAF